MKNENRAVFDRASEHYDFAFDLPPKASASEPEAEETITVAKPAKHPRFKQIIAWLTGKIRSRRNRMAILELSDDQLKDIGVARCQADGNFTRYRQSESHQLERKCL